jgi:hypothetical protein
MADAEHLALEVVLAVRQQDVEALLHRLAQAFGIDALGGYGGDRRRVGVGDSLGRFPLLAQVEVELRQVGAAIGGPGPLAHGHEAEAGGACWLGTAKSLWLS